MLILYSFLFVFLSFYFITFSFSFCIFLSFYRLRYQLCVRMLHAGISPPPSSIVISGTASSNSFVFAVIYYFITLENDLHTSGWSSRPTSTGSSLWSDPAEIPDLRAEQNNNHTNNINT